MRFRLQYVSGVNGATLLPDPGEGLRTVPHRDRVVDRLATLARSKFVADYVRAAEASLARLGSALWSPRHTSALIEEFWPASARWEKNAAEQSQLFLGDPESADLHPGKHLESMLADCTDAGTAYEVLCSYLDLDSEACKSGDFTADRDERLVNGAVEEIKNRIWTWVVANT